MPANCQRGTYQQAVDTAWGKGVGPVFVGKLCCVHDKVTPDAYRHAGAGQRAEHDISWRSQQCEEERPCEIKLLLDLQAPEMRDDPRVSRHIMKINRAGSAQIRGVRQVIRQRAPQMEMQQWLQHN